MVHADMGKRLGLSMQVLIGQEVEGQILFFIFFGQGEKEPNANCWKTCVNLLMSVEKGNNQEQLKPSGKAPAESKTKRKFQREQGLY